MDILGSPRPLETVFQELEGRYFDFDPTGEPTIYNRYVKLNLSLGEFNRISSTQESENTDSIVLVSIDSKGINAKQREILDLANIWSIPPLAAEAILSTMEEGYHNQQIDDEEFRWFSVLIPGEANSEGRLVVINCHRAAKAEPDSSDANSGPNRIISNSLILCPKIFLSEVQALIGRCEREFPVEAMDGIVATVRFEVALMEAVLQLHDKQEKAFSVNLALTLAYVQSCEKTGFGSDENIKMLSSLLDKEDIHRGEIKVLQHIVVSLRERAANEQGNRGRLTAAKVDNACRIIFDKTELVIKRYKGFSKILQNFQKKHIHSLRTKSDLYTRTNTIALRRLASQNKREAVKMQQIEQITRRDSALMKKLAILSMIYLPASFTATFFSMPFWAVDDKLKFSALPKIWVYFPATSVLMVLTFLVGMYWDKFITAKAARVQAETVDEGNMNADPDEAFLEPGPTSDVTADDLWEILAPTVKQMKKGKSNYNLEHEQSSEDEISSEDEQDENYASEED